MSFLTKDPGSAFDELGLESPFAEAWAAEGPLAYEQKAGPDHSFKCCSSAQKAQLVDAASRALRAIRRASAFVGTAHGRPDNMSPAMRQLLLKHFHTTKGEHLRTILTKLMRIGKALADGVKFECEIECKPGIQGSAKPTQWFGGFGPVHICFDGRVGYHNFTTETPAEQEAIVIHEVAHRYVGLRGDIYHKGAQYAAMSPGQALDNCDSYAYFSVESASLPTSMRSREAEAFGAPESLFEGADAGGTVRSLGETIAQIADQQYTFWNSGEELTKEVVAKTLSRYVIDGLNRKPTTAERSAIASRNPRPWGAVFVSWVMRAAGAGSGFAYSTKDRTYIQAAQANRRNKSASPFWAYRPTEIIPEAGDTICEGNGATYDNIGPVDQKIRCHIITEVDSRSFRAVGWVNAQIVGAKTFNRLKDGRLDLKGGQAHIFAVISCRGAKARLAPPSTAPEPKPRPAPSRPRPARAAAAGGAREDTEASPFWESAASDREQSQQEAAGMTAAQFEPGEAFDSDQSETEAALRWADESLAWLDVEASEAETEWLESPISESEGFEPEDEGFEPEDEGFEPEDEWPGTKAGSWTEHEALAPEDGRWSESGAADTTDTGEDEAFAIAGAALEALLVTEVGEHEEDDVGIRALGAFFLGGPLKKGSKGDHVKILQRALAKLGARLTDNGEYGPATESAVRAFQRRWGLTPTGVADGPTKNAIADALRPVPLCDRIAQIAEEEFGRWHPAKGELRETQRAALPILRQYWDAVGEKPTDANLQRSRWQDENPWSAAFISWVMRKAGATGFKAAAKHVGYIRAALANKAANLTTNPFWAYPATDVAPQVGDLICRSRNNSGVTLGNINDDQTQLTHCDIVTKVRPHSLRVIGGNVCDDVGFKTIRTQPNGRLALDDEQALYFAVVSCRGALAVSGPPPPAPVQPKPAGPTP